jgi:polysaccharide deacetylase family protein (PEP-CTERM system associated)
MNVSARPAGSTVNALSVDVEDYFQVSALEPKFPRSRWDAIPCRIEKNVERVLSLFDTAGVKATFFTLGWVAQRFPGLVRAIVAGGHELASHGLEHVRATTQGRHEFREDIRRAKGLLEDVGGVSVFGYRAASWSIGAGNLWAWDELESAGHRYSSSVFPIEHDLYGMPDARRFPFRPPAHGILEIPATTLRFGGRNWPCAGGGWFRLLPYAVSRWALRRINHHEGQPALFYFHPWELDPGQPRPPGLGMKTRVRHYLNLNRMEHRLARLLGDFAWDRMDRVFLGEAP